MSGHLSRWMSRAVCVSLLTVNLTHALWGQRTVAADTRPGDVDPRVAQALFSRPVTVTLDHLTLRQAIDTIVASAGVSVVYHSDVLEAVTRRVSLRLTGVSLRSALDQVLAGTTFIPVPLATTKVAIVETSGATHVQTGEGILRGRIVDSTKRTPLARVVVSVVGTSLVTLTTEHGTYTLPHVPAGTQRVTMRLLGYAATTRTLRVADGDSTTLDVSLVATPTALTEIVTTVTGAQRRVEIPNDIARVNADSLMRTAPILNTSDLIAAAHVPGVLVTPSSGDPGAPSRIRIRGIGSISESNDPVIIVDGVWITSQMSANVNVNQATNGYMPTRLDNLDPASIETIEIVRGPSAATLYGPQAANGVIVITTKKGHAGQTHFSLSMRDNYTSLPSHVPNQYQGIGHPLASNTVVNCSVYEAGQQLCVQDSVRVTNPVDPFTTTETAGWARMLTASLDGGAPQFTYALTGTRSTNDGNRKISDVDAARLRLLNIGMPSDVTRPASLGQTSLTARADALPRPDLDIGLSYTTTVSDQVQSVAPALEQGWDVLRNNLRDTVSVLLTSGTVTGILGTSSGNDNTFGVSANWTPRTWLTGRANAGADRSAQDNQSTYLSYGCVLGACTSGSGSKTIAHADQTVYSGSTNLNVRPSLGHLNGILSLQPSIGFDYRQNTTSGVVVSGGGLPPGSQDISTATTVVSRQNEDQTAVAGWYLTTQVGVFDRLYFNVGFRQDIGSAITSSSALPKLGGSWLVSDERWFPRQPVVTSLRLRAAYGVSTVEPDITDIDGRFMAGKALINGVYVPTVTLTQAQNSILRPERAQEFESGADISFFDDRATFTITSSQRRNSEDLIQRTLAPSAGVGDGASRKENIALVVNRDLELSLATRIIDNRSVLWTVTANTTILDNRVSSLGNAVTPFGPSTDRIVQGYPIAGVWAQRILGYNDVNQDGIIEPNEVIVSDSLGYVGWGQPRYTASYTSSLALFNGRLKLDAAFSYDGSYVETQPYNGIGAQDVNASLASQAYGILNTPAANLLYSGGDPQTISDLRFNSASVALMLPATFARSLRASSATISLQGSNLAVWTKYRGRDPGLTANPLTEGLVDTGALTPTPRLYVLQLNLTY